MRGTGTGTGFDSAFFPTEPNCILYLTAATTIQAVRKERNPQKYIQDVIGFLWREAIAAEEVLKVILALETELRWE